MKAEEPGLLTDLYELTMAQAYYEHGMFAPATFSLFIRQYPPGRSFFVAAGLEDVLTYLEGWEVSPRVYRLPPLHGDVLLRVSGLSLEGQVHRGRVGGPRGPPLLRR